MCHFRDKFKARNEIPGGRTEEGTNMYLTLHCHHQNDLRIKMGCDVSHFNVSLLRRAKSRGSVLKPSVPTLCQKQT